MWLQCFFLEGSGETEYFWKFSEFWRGNFILIRIPTSCRYRLF